MDDRYENPAPQGGEPGERQDDASGRTGQGGYRSGAYHSQYDSYRFRAPGNDRPPVPPAAQTPPAGKRNGVLTFFAIIGIAAVLVAAAVLIYVAVLGVSPKELIPEALRKMPERKPRSEIVLGRQDSENTESDLVRDVDEAESILSRAEAALSEEAQSEEAQSEEAQSEEAQSEETLSGEAGAYLTVPEIVEKVMPSMVSITNVTVGDYMDLFGETKKYEGVSAGSGIIVGESETDLLVATNYHVVSSSDNITVTFVDGTALAGEARSADEDNDLAIISIPLKDIPAETREAVAVVTIGDSDEVRVGESVVAIGNALGYGQSVSSGIISARGQIARDTAGNIKDVLQTDASINPGNSGGALLNMKGELIGINEAKYVSTKVEGVGYAIPMATALPILTKLGNRTARTRVSEEEASYIGITCMTLPEEYTSAGYPAGVYVLDIEQGGPAEHAGLLAGDVITALEGKTVRTQEALIDELTYYAAGEEVDVTVSRLDEESGAFEKKTVRVMLGDRKDMKIEAPSAEPAESAAEEAESGAAAQEETGEAAEEEAEPEEPAQEEPEESAAEEAEEPAQEEPEESAAEEAEESSAEETESRSRIPGGRYRGE